MIKFWRFLSISIVAAVCLGLLLVPGATPQAAANGNEWGFEILPTTTKVGVSEDFNVTVSAVRYSGDADTWQVMLDFDQNYLEVVGITRPATLPNPPDNSTPDGYPGEPTLDNTDGSVYDGYSVPPVTATINTSFDAWTIHFRSKDVNGTTYLNFVYVNPYHSTKAILGGLDYLNWTKVVNGTVVVGPAFNLTVTSDGCCPITVGGLGTVAAGSSELFIVPCPSVILTADASDACCDFVNWTGNVSATDIPVTTVAGSDGEDLTATATCSVPQYNLTMNVTGSGTTNASGSNPRSCGEEVDINATADPGWEFVNWTGDVGNVTDVDLANTTITMYGNYLITANFVERFTLTMNVTNNGTTDPAVGDHDCDNGTVVDITAIPDPCWDFVNWTGDVADPNSTSTNVTVDADKTVIANFARVNYTLNITITGSGNVTLNGTITPTLYPNSTSYINCTVVNLTATPDADYSFVNWTGDVADPNSISTNITVDANKTVIANFGPHDFFASPISLTFTTVEGENPPSQTLEVCNTGNGTLNWTLEDNAGWLDENPTSGSLNETDCKDVTVSVDVAGMGAGDYTATITVTGSPVQEVPVSLHIESAMMEIPGGPAGLSASALSISPQQVEPDQEVTISINVANTGGETGSYNAVLYINSVVEDSQTVSVAPGTTKNVIFTVSKSDAGVYDVSLAGQSGQFQVVGGDGWFGGGLGTGGIVAIVVIVIALIVALVFILRGTRREV